MVSTIICPSRRSTWSVRSRKRPRRRRRCSKAATELIMAATMHIDVVSAEESIYSGEAEFVVLPGVEGELGIYPRHTPLITQIKAGTVRIKVPGKTEEELVYVQGGFLEVQHDHVNVLSETAIRKVSLQHAHSLETKWT